MNRGKATKKLIAVIMTQTMVNDLMR